MNFSQTSVPYSKRRARTFWWTIVLYLILVSVMGLSNSFGSFLYFFPLLTIIFAFDYSRRLGWVRYTINEITTDYSGVNLSYFDKEHLLTVTIPWDKFSLSKGTTFTRYPRCKIIFKGEEGTIATFYSDDAGDNKRFNELYKNLTKLKTANA